MRKPLFLISFAIFFLSNCFKINAQTFDVFIANDSATSPTVYEFDVFLRNTTTVVGNSGQVPPNSGNPWAFRTIQFGFYVNPNWLPAGPAPTITPLSGTTGLISYSPGFIQINSPSFDAFSVAANSAGACGGNTYFTTNGQTVRIVRFRITSNSGNMNCVPANISMIRPILADPSPGGPVSLKMAVTRWTDPACGVGTSTTISNNGTYTSIAGGTLLQAYNNMAPPTTAPANVTIPICATATFSVYSTPNPGQTTSISYQWMENGNPILNGGVYSGATTNTLTITNPPASLDGYQYSVKTIQCGTHTGTPATLTLTACINLQLKLFIEGFYLGGGVMNAVVNKISYPSLCDTIFVELRQPSYPYNVLYSDKTTIDINGNGTARFPSNANGQNFYISIHHRNAITTWSSNLITLNMGGVNYDFTTAASKAYGNNQSNLGDGNFAFWSGDVSSAATGIIGMQDGVIESQDYGDIENAVYFTLKGYRVEDLTGDRIVESSDYVLIENNVYYSIFSMHP